MTIDELPGAIFQALREMDREADTVRDGFPTGLNWYGGHVRPDQKRPRTEPAWSRALCERLDRSDLSAINEHKYPGDSRKRCDCVVSGDDWLFWLEIKGAWKEYWRTRSEWIYRSYLLHPLAPDLDKSRTHTAALDLRRIETLSRDNATHVGLLIVGFDSHAAPMDDDIEEFATLAEINDQPWLLRHDAWSDEHRQGERIRLWLWMRKVA